MTVYQLSVKNPHYKNALHILLDVKPLIWTLTDVFSHTDLEQIQTLF
jgi:hypothetical protein